MLIFIKKNVSWFLLIYFINPISIQPLIPFLDNLRTPQSSTLLILSHRHYSRPAESRCPFKPRPTHLLSFRTHLILATTARRITYALARVPLGHHRSAFGSFRREQPLSRARHSLSSCAKPRHIRASRDTHTVAGDDADIVRSQDEREFSATLG